MSILEDPESKGWGNSCRMDSEGGLTRPEPTRVSGQCVRMAPSASLLRSCSDFALSPGDAQPVPTLHLQPGWACVKPTGAHVPAASREP